MCDEFIGFTNGIPWDFNQFFLLVKDYQLGNKLAYQIFKV